MRIAFICFDNIRFTFLKGLYNLFKEQGHDVRAFYEHNVEQGHTLCRWLNFKLDPIIAFKPDRIIFFNGFAQQSLAATAYISKRWPTYYVEQAWLPQKDNIYIDKIGLGGRSSLAGRDLSVSSEDTLSVVQKLRELYTPGIDPGLGEYILVPLQLETDTSILLDSPHFKTMESLVDFVVCKFFDNKVIVKAHPRAKKTFDLPNIITDIDVNTLSYYAKAIVGINSTSLIEALVHEKPIVSMGRGVLSSSKVFVGIEQGLKNPRIVLGYVPDKAAIHNALYNLYSSQFNKHNPPVSVVNKVIDLV